MAMRGKIDRIEVASFYFHLERDIIKLREELLTKTYQPRAYAIFEIQDPKVRQICSSRFRDRVVYHAICSVLEPFFERRLIFDSYACRVNKGSHAAIARCQTLIRSNEYYLKCDIKKFFETLDHSVLKKLLQRMFKDTHLFWLLEKIIDHPVPGGVSNRGIPIYPMLIRLLGVERNLSVPSAWRNDRDQAPTASFVAAASTTMRRTAVRLIATTNRRTTTTTISASVW